MDIRCGALACLLAAVGCSASQDAGDVSTAPVPSVASVKAESAEPAEADDGVQQQVKGEPVTATLRLAPAHANVGEFVVVSVMLNIAPLWEIHTLNSSSRNVATRLELELPDALQPEEEWQAPEPIRSDAPDAHAAYADEVVFARRLLVQRSAVAGEYPVKCRVNYQACNEHQCLRPTAVELSVSLHID